MPDDERDAAQSDERGSEAFRLSWKRVRVHGRPVDYGEGGTGPTVVFLHGWGLDHRVYKRSLGRLAAAGAHVLAPALPGFGGTSLLSDERMSFAGFGSWVADFLDVVGEVQPVLVMGHSFGGGVAVAFAHDHPRRVRGLVLINSVGASAWATRGVTPRTMAQRPLWDWGVKFPADLWPLGEARRVIPAVVGEAVTNLIRDPQAMWRVAGLARRADLRRELEELKRRRLPVVVLWGSRDRLITKEAFEETCELLGRPQAVTVDGSHGWLIVDPDTFAEVVTNVVDIAARPRPRQRGWHPLRSMRGRIEARSRS